FFSSRRRHTRFSRDWSSDVCSSDLSAFDVTAGVSGCSQVALIFNIGAGYDPAYGILDTLGAYGVTCSMFVMGWLAEQNPALVQRSEERRVGRERRDGDEEVVLGTKE